MAVKEGWRGRFFEDFTVGDIYQHPYGRTITDADNVWFTNLTMNPNQIHFNLDYAFRTQHQQPLVNSCFTLSLVTGLSVMDVSQNGINLEWKEVRMPNPLFVGETVYAQSEVLDKRESKSKPNMGIITIKTIGLTEKGKVVLELTRSIMVYKQEFAPQTNLFPRVYG